MLHVYTTCNTVAAAGRTSQAVRHAFDSLASGDAPAPLAYGYCTDCIFGE